MLRRDEKMAARFGIRLIDSGPNRLLVMAKARIGAQLTPVQLKSLIENHLPFVVASELIRPEAIV